MGEQEEVVWLPPQYYTSTPPRSLFTGALVPDVNFPENFARNAKWCPDGSIALSQCENRTFQFLNLPPELLAASLPQSPSGIPSVQPHYRVLRQAGPIIEYTWYPSASVYNPASFCFVASVRDCPVKLLDASDGRLRASYKIVDHRERQIAPHSIVFSPSADKLYCGFEDAIEIFDVHRPGEGTRLHTTPSKKTKEGLKGIISTLAFTPPYTPTSLLAAGSLTPASPHTPNIGLFSPDSRGEPIALLGGAPRVGVSQLAFNPAAPHMLYAAFRGAPGVCAWDLRGDVGAPVRVLCGPARASARRTNQRMRFDIDAAGRWLAFGDVGGWVELYDLQERTEPVLDPESGAYAEDPPELAPTLRYRAHEDGVGGVAFHPLRPVLLSVAGSRHFDEAPRVANSTSSIQASEEEDSGSGSDSDIIDEAGEAVDVDGSRAVRPAKASRVTVLREKQAPATRDASVKLWGFDEPGKPEGGG